MPQLLKVRNLQTQFYARHSVVKAVDGVSFDLDEGETLALVGESGCGKSVTAMSILRLIPNPPGKIVGGEIFFQGRDLLKISEDEVRDIRGNDIAMVFQEPMTSLNPALTIGRQISEPMEVHQGITLKKGLLRAKDLLGKVNIAAPERRIHDYPHQFSGGMRQRAMIAMGLGCNPKLIIADEPTTALDVTVQAQLLELMKNLTREYGTALILITHNLGVVARYADRVNVMYAGRIVEKGTALEIYDDPRHPYTIGLLKSVPQLDQDVKTRLVPVRGQPPDLSKVPEGCAFYPRCDFATDRCRKESPVLETVSGNHEKACWIDVK